MNNSLMAPAILLAALLAACSGKTGDPASEDAQGTPVRTEAAKLGPAMPVISTSGIVVTKDEIRLSFKVGGIVKRIPVREGQQVHQGQLLAEIEPAEVNSQLEQSRQIAAKAQRDLERGERLHADQVISLEQLQDLRTQASVARAALAAIEFNRGYSVITAPRSGVVLRKLVEQSELVPAGQPVVVLGAREQGYVVRMALSDREIVQVRLGDVADVRMDAFPDRRFTARVSEIAGGADEKTGMFLLEARLEDLRPEGARVSLVSGLVARVSLVPASARAGQLSYVPVAAIVAGDGRTASVFVVDGERVRRRLVRVAFMQGEQVAVAEGLKAGEIVVTDGALYLEDNEKIHVVSEAGLAVGSLDISSRTGAAG